MYQALPLTFEEAYVSDEHGTITLYFQTDTSILGGKYPEAESATISVEFSLSDPNAEYAYIGYSPCLDGSDYDWNDWPDCPDDFISKLLRIYIQMEEKNHD